MKPTHIMKDNLLYVKSTDGTCSLHPQTPSQPHLVCDLTTGYQSLHVTFTLTDTVTGAQGRGHLAKAVYRGDTASAGP